MNQGDIRAALASRPRDVLTCTLYGEASGEARLSQIGVGCCIRNRVNLDLHHDGKPDWWGEGYAGVCLAPWQFSCWSELTAPNTQRVYALAESMLAGAPPPRDPAVVATLSAIAAGIIDGAIPDVTSGATHYLTHYLLVTAPPKWARGQKPCAIVGSHTYFRLEA